MIFQRIRKYCVHLEMRAVMDGGGLWWTCAQCLNSRHQWLVWTVTSVANTTPTLHVLLRHPVAEDSNVLHGTQNVIPWVLRQVEISSALYIIHCLVWNEIVYITILYSVLTDEEIGGHKGMEIFIKTPEFKNLNVGFALDEGLFVYFNVY